MNELPVRFTIEMGVAEWADAQAVLRIQQKISSNIVKHNGVFAMEELVEFSPNNSQWLDLKNWKENYSLKNFLIGVCHFISYI